MPAKHTSKPKETIRSLPARTTQPPSPSVPPGSSETNGKKKKKKKGNNKARDPDDLSKHEYEDDDELPPLESVPPLRTALSPELESVHLSATASLSASAAAAAKSNPTAAAQAELIAAADDLCRRMDADPQGGIADDDVYWASLPAHIRSFVCNTYSQTTSPGNERAKAQSMYSIAQQMVQSSGVKSHSPSKGAPGYPPGAYPPSLPLDPSVFSRSHFSMVMEQAAASYLPPPHSPPLNRGTHFQLTV